MTNDPASREEQEAWGLETRLVHGGSLRSQFAETSEALFLTQSYVYASAEQAEERFKSEAGFIYSRYANPTVAMFEERMRLLEGAGRRARHRDRHGGGDVVAAVLPQGRRPRRGGARAVRLVPVRGGGAVSALRHRLDAGRRPRHQGLGARRAPQHQGVLLRDAGQPDARPRRHRRRVRDRARRGRAGGGRQRVRHAGAAEAPEARRRRRRLFRHQARRRPGPLPRRRRAGLAGLREGPPAQLPQAHRALAQPLQCVGDAQGPGDAAPARARAMRDGGQGSPTIWPARRA